MKKISFFIVIFLSLFISCPKALEAPIQNTPSQNDKYKDYSYVIDKYDINVKVNENNSFDITETITAHFNTEKHGIIRKIPVHNKVKTKNKTYTNRAKITNLSVNDTYKVSKENDYYQIQIGDENKTLTGSKTYKIKYNYNIGKDPNKNFDEFYYNLIGNDWDTVIGNITATIEFPKKTDFKKVDVFVGLKNSQTKVTQDLTNSKNILLSYNNILNPGMAITVRLKLPEGYFQEAHDNIYLTDYIAFIGPLICLILAFITWYKYGRDDKVVDTVEFYPPKGLNSLDVAFLYKGEADEKDIMTLLIYLASKGYLKIVEGKNKKQTKIVKLKEYDGQNKIEKMFMDGLFKPEKSSDEPKTEVTLKDLQNKFYKTINKILRSLNSQKRKNKIIDKKLLSKRKYIIAFAIICIFTSAVLPLTLYTSLISSALFAIFLYMLIGFTLILIYTFFLKGGSIIAKLFILAFTIFILYYSSATMNYIAVLDNYSTLELIVGAVSLIIIFIIFKFMPKRTEYGIEMLGKIKGFKKFLKIAKKEELEQKVKENPNYFYDIMPYTYVLGVSKKWIKKFTDIKINDPEWYEGESYQYLDIERTISYANNSMTSHPIEFLSDNSSTSSSSDFSSSAGGGSGGGGGSSW